MQQPIHLLSEINYSMSVMYQTKLIKAIKVLKSQPQNSSIYLSRWALWQRVTSQSAKNIQN